MMDVRIEDAYREACTALGEAIVRERLMASEIDRLTAPSTSKDFITLANGRRAAQLPTGEWVAADDGGWLPGVRPNLNDWLTDD